MESQLTTAKRQRISVEESTTGQHQQAEMEARSNNRRMCNELVWELCKEIPIVKTSERTLLTSQNMYAYLALRFPKMWIYRDAIAFLKVKLTKEYIEIRIEGVNQNNESELETNHFIIRIENRFSFSAHNNIYGHFAYLQLHYFLRLIAPLLKQIHLDFYWSDGPIECLVPFVNALNGCIDSIGLTPKQFNSAPIKGALSKYNKLEIYCPQYSSVNVPKLVNWLTTSNTNGQSKKYLYVWGSVSGIANATQFLDEMKKDFARATSKCRFVVRLICDASLAQFTFCNELTGEILQLRRTSSKYGRINYALNRFPNNEMDNTTEFDPDRMTNVILY